MAIEYLTEMQLANAAVTVQQPIRFAETDAMGVVHHSVYVIWFEVARIAWMDAAGMPYAEVAAGGNHFAVTGIEVTYRQSVRFGDAVSIEVRPTRLRSRQVNFTYGVYNDATGALLANGASRHICVDSTGQMAQIPGAVMARLQAGIERLIRTNAG